MLSLKNKFFALVVLAFLAFESNSYAQRQIDPEGKPPLKDRMYFGGNFGMQFGTVTLLDISPLAGVMITPRFSSGLGITYQYFNDRRFVGGETTSYGGRIFSRYNVLPNVFAHAEFESINFDNYNFVSDQFERIWSNALFLGGGYFAPFGQNGGANFTFLYNVLHDNLRSPYGEPYVIRVGFVL
ncbi:hypothetical protein ACFOSV_03920 [Algoriphagus namhaensis]|uniref:Outer membrane protein beta-barrel domain-containing protein n=1 Tax=Algoriphagus namhaensis TaxID=915353 RepID=A0ABV8AR06_9BACT